MHRLALTLTVRTCIQIAGSMDISGNLTTSVFISSLSNTSSITRVNSQNSDLVEQRAEQADTPSRRIRPLTQVASKIRDVNDSVSLLQNLEANYSSLNDGLNKISLLAQNATNEELDNEQRFNLNERAQVLKERLIEGANRFSFNGAPLSQPDESLSFQIVANANGNIKLSALDMESVFNEANFDQLDLSTVEKAEESVSILEELETDINAISDNINQSSERLDDFISTLSFTEKEAQKQLSASFDTIVARDIASLIQEQLKNSDSVFIQLDPETDKRQVLGLLKS